MTSAGGHTPLPFRTRPREPRAPPAARRAQANRVSAPAAPPRSRARRRAGPRHARARGDDPAKALGNGAVRESDAMDRDRGTDVGRALPARVTRLVLHVLLARRELTDPASRRSARELPRPRRGPGWRARSPLPPRGLSRPSKPRRSLAQRDVRSRCARALAKAAPRPRPHPRSPRSGRIPPGPRPIVSSAARSQTSCNGLLGRDRGLETGSRIGY